MERRLVGDYHIQWTGVKLPLTRSIITQGTTEQLSVYRLLRVLDEDGYHLHGDYFGNVNLRYICYKLPTRDCRPFELPTSISCIWNLQSFIVKRALSLLIVAPTEFWTMRQLRHVECFKIFIPSPLPSNGLGGFLMLENLRTLKTTVNLRLCDDVCKIIPNIMKLHLVYDRRLQGYDEGLIECLRNLERLPNLESLKLFTISRIRELEPKKKLTVSFPNSLKKLSLSLCKLQWDDLIMIGALPQLEVLKLGASSVEGEGEWSLIDGQFQRMKFLKIQSCDLVFLDADNSHFPVLEKLILNNLRRLEVIPLSIGDIPTLELIHMEYCTNSAAISAIRIKEEQLENGGQVEVQVAMSKSDSESFNKLLELEGLTIDNIGLEMH